VAGWARKNLLTDSGIVSSEEVTARAARLSGQDADEPPRPEPHKPDMPSGGAGNLRSLDAPPAFAGRSSPCGSGICIPTGTPGCRDTCGGGPERSLPSGPPQVLPTAPRTSGARTRSMSTQWNSARASYGEPAAESFSLIIDLFEPYLEPAT